jgi:hypothetical protein
MATCPAQPRHTAGKKATQQARPNTADIHAVTTLTVVRAVIEPSRAQGRTHTTTRRT